VIKWSFSGLKQFVNCPRQFNEVKNLKNFAVRESVQMRYGTEVHKALEEYAKDRTPLPKNYSKFKSLVDALLEIPGDKYIEHKMALTSDKSPCEFDAEDYWVRGIADLLIVDGEDAFVVDYKTGSNRYPDPKQLKLMALMVFAHFPDVVRVRGGLLFVVHNSFLPDEYVRSKSVAYWQDFAPDLERLRLSAQMNNWPTNPTPLCRWCPVKTCEYHKE
jgi:hypothetical protein